MIFHGVICLKWISLDTCRPI